MKLKQITILNIGVMLGILLLLQSPTRVFAQVVFTDTFSNGYEKWQDVRNTFDLWSIVNLNANVFISTGSTLAEIIPKDEYWNNDWKNYIYKLDYTYLAGADKALSFWFQDIFNWHQFHFVRNSYILSHIENGIEVWRESGDLVLEAGKTHKMEVHLKDGNIQFFMDGEKKFEHDDPTFDNDYGRIGLKAGAGTIAPTHVQFNNIEVSLISDSSDSAGSSDFIVSVPSLKQIDPSWKDIEYDSATRWASQKFGIGAWGCLVTSINMILQYYGINSFPDGTNITPVTLNQWLQQQPDGFIGPGLVNWSAVSRLVKEISSATGSVNLEYSRTNGQSLETAITKIQNEQPVILEIPGHFLVGNGFTENHDDIFITDPAYSYQRLSEHQTPISSTRMLTPSYTDLSYIHMAHDSSISVSLVNEQKIVPENYESYTQALVSFPHAESSPSYVLHEFAKPKSGNYILSVSSTTQVPQPFQLTIFTYDSTANFSNLTYSGVAGTTENPTVLELSYNKNGQSTIKNTSDFENLLIDVKDLLHTHQIKKQYVAFELTQLTQAATRTEQNNKPRYVSALTQTIQWYSEHISESAKTTILERLREIQNTL